MTHIWVVRRLTVNRKFKVSTKSMYKIEVARVKLSNLISSSNFINTNQMSIHLFPVMHLYALHQFGAWNSRRARKMLSMPGVNGELYFACKFSRV
jgi:hypothetical protein